MKTFYPGYGKPVAIRFEEQLDLDVQEFPLAKIVTITASAPQPSEMPSRDYPLRNVLLREPLWRTFSRRLMRLRWGWLHVAVILVVGYLLAEVAAPMIGGAR